MTHLRTPVLETNRTGHDRVLPSRPPIFVLGCPRSGTTLLSSLLESTPWGAPFETFFVTKYAKRYRGVDLSDRNRFRELTRQLLAERPTQQWRLHLDVDAFHARLAESGEGAFTYANVVSALACQNMARAGYASWGDKTPHYVLDLELLHELYPESRFIYIVRDGRDVAMSLMQKPWGQANVYTAARYWRACHEPRPILDHLRARGLLYDVRYEDLTRDPEGILPQVLEFLGEDPQKHRIDEITAPVDRSNFDKWRTRLSAIEIADFERVAASVLDHHGYETSRCEERVPARRRVRYELQELWKHGTHMIRQNVFDGIAIRLGRKEPFAD